MTYRIISNNPLVRDEMRNIRFVDGSYEDVLIEVRDLIYLGVELISHPIGASIRMMYSPYRSIIVGQKTCKINPIHTEIIENSIINYRKKIEERKIDWRNERDYATVDKELLMSTLNSLESDHNYSI